MKIKRIVTWVFSSSLMCINILAIVSSELQFLPVERCHWGNETCESYIKGYTRAMTEEVWGQAGIVAYQAAAQWMRANNGSSQELDESQKQHLRPYFGSLVDRVAIVYNAKLIDDWLYADFQIDIGQVDAIAQTYCRRIYIESSYKSSDPSQLTLLAHELVHSMQCEQLGGADKFGYYYFKEFKRANQSYENNKLEREADDFQGKFARWLSHQLANKQAIPIPTIN